MIQMRTLGLLDLRGSDGRALRSILAQPKRLALLSYLAVTSVRGFLRRDQALALFWPDHDDERARAALNRALYYLRKALGDDILLSRGDDEIGLSAEGFWCDAGAFTAAVAEGRFGDAVELYRGDLLEGFHVSDAPGFERWVDTERDRLRELAVRAARALAEAAQSARNYALAAHWARWVSERSPYDEVAIQRLMTLLDRSGDRAGALHAFEQFTRRITSDLELSPAPETRALADAIRTREQPVSEIGILAGPDERAPTNAHARSLSPVDPSIGAESAGRPVVDAVVPAGPALEAPARPRSWRRTMAAAGAAVILLSVAATALLVVTRRTDRDPRLIIALPVQNLTGDPSLDGLARIATDLTLQGLADVVEATTSLPRTGGSRVERGAEGAVDIRRVARQTRAGTVVSGAVFRDGRGLRFHARIDALTQGVTWSIRPISVPFDSSGPAIHEVRDRVTGALAALLNPCVSTWLPFGTEPPTLAAYQEFARGNYQGAAQLDTAFTWAVLHAAANDMRRADGWIIRRGIKDDRLLKADSIAGFLTDMRGRIAPLQRHWVDWKLALRSRNWLAGYDAMQQAHKLVPDAFTANVAGTAYQIHRPREGLELLERAAPDASCYELKARWFLMAELYHQLREHKRELEVVSLARKHEDGLDVLWHEVRARAALGQTDRVMALLDTALSYPPTEDYAAGALMLTAAAEFRGHGHRKAFTDALARGIAWYRSRPGDEASTEFNRFRLADAAYLDGQLTEADSLFRTLAGEWPQYEAEVQGYLGAIAARRRESTPAERILRKLEHLTQSTERPVDEVFYARARIRALLGDREGAVSSLRDWIGGQGFDLHTEMDFEPLTDYPPFREFIRPKG